MELPGRARLTHLASDLQATFPLVPVPVSTSKDLPVRINDTPRHFVAAHQGEAKLSTSASLTTKKSS
jgi:hypothetical protein